LATTTLRPSTPWTRVTPSIETSMVPTHGMCSAWSDSAFSLRHELITTRRYQEPRYNNGGNTTAHGMYARNAHGQEWLLRNRTITYRTLGGSFDLYFLSGQTPGDGSSSAQNTISQFISGCVGEPAMQQYWTFGFHQCQWGYQKISASCARSWTAIEMPTYRSRESGTISISTSCTATSRTYVRQSQLLAKLLAEGRLAG